MTPTWSWPRLILFPTKEIEILRGTVILRSGQRIFKGGEQEKIKSTQRKSMRHKGILLLKLKKRKRWLSKSRHSPPSLTAWDGFLEPTEWNERTHSKKLSSDLNTHAVGHTCPHIFTYTINTCKNQQWQLCTKNLWIYSACSLREGWTSQNSRKNVRICK